jgi:hypothetical protein
MRHKSLLPQVATTLLLAWCLSVERSAAEVSLSGTPDRVVLRTQDATLTEIVAALRSTFDLEVKLNGATARMFTGMYSGSVRQVLSRLLTGQDYVLRSAADGMNITLFGASAAVSTVARPAVLPAAQGSRLVALRQGRIRRTSDSE